MSNLTLQEQLSALKSNMFVENKEIIKVNKIDTEDKIHSNMDNRAVTNMNDKKNYRKPQRAEIWYVDLGVRKGSLQSGRRPFLISSNSVSNKYANIVNGFPITSKLNKANIPVHVEIEGFNLEEKSLILTEQVTTIDIRYELLYYVGTVDELLMKRVDRARNIQLGDLQPKNTLERLSDESRQYTVNKIKFIETCKQSIEFLKSIEGDKYSINLAEDEKFKEENALQYYCYKNKIDYNEIYNNYIELERKKEESIAL